MVLVKFATGSTCQSLPQISQGKSSDSRHVCDVSSWNAEIFVFKSIFSSFVSFLSEVISRHIKSSYSVKR